jgi:acylphosphatase
MTIRKRVLVSGLVQGVCFRAYTRDTARRLGVTGWVRNLPDGTVEAVVEGESAIIQSMLEWFHEGPPYSRVDRVSVQDEPSHEKFNDFDIRYGLGAGWL